MKVIYVAGPFRGPHHWAIAQNIRKAEELSLEVWRIGCAAVCPHLNTAHYQGVLPDDVWLYGDLAILARCDAMIVVPNWEHSKGTQGEIYEAERLEIPIFYNLASLIAWHNVNA
jgi:hypothetical protein